MHDNYDFCIVGTGAAGGILAYRLAQSGASVVSLEQGEAITDSYFTNHLSAEQQPHFGIGPTMPWPMLPMEAYRFANREASQLYATPETSSTSPSSAKVFANRQVFHTNGKQNLWNAVALRYSERDFRGRDFGDSDINWPIDYGMLEPHYSAVEKMIGVCGTHEGLECLPDGEFIPPLPLRPVDRLVMKGIQRMGIRGLRAIPTRKAVETRLEQSHHCRSCGECVFGCSYGSVFKFSSHLLPKIAHRPNYDIRYNSKVVRLWRATDRNLIDRLECLDTRTRSPFNVHAKVFILCAGAMETPRILFNSSDETFRGGLANSSGVLGCYLQDTVRATTASSLLRLAGRRDRYEANCNDHLLIPRVHFDNGTFRGGYQCQVCHVLPSRPYYLNGISLFPSWSRKWLARMLFQTFVALLFVGKPQPTRTNRVFPSQVRDAFGVPQVDVAYAPSENDILMKSSMVKMGKRILKRCSGYVVEVSAEQSPGSSIHYAGTCRMASTSTDGIVDKNLRCFDHSNLFLCDGSVFPDISEKNLTLTIMALAHRLGDYLLQHDAAGCT